MPKAKTATIDPEVIEETPEMEEFLDEEDMDGLDDLSEVFESSLTVGIPKEQPKYQGPRVTVMLPLLDDPGDGGIKVDQYEHVTIANERGETCYKVRRGEPVEVPVPVFMILKARYPKI